MDWFKEQLKITPEFVEGLKEVLRLVILAIVSVLITYLSSLPYEWTGAVILILRFIDKWMYAGQKIEAEEKGTTLDGKYIGLTGF